MDEEKSKYASGAPRYARCSPLPDEEAPTDRDWTDLEWVRNQLWLANLDCDAGDKALEAERRWRKEAVRMLDEYKKQVGTMSSVNAHAVIKSLEKVLLADQPKEGE